MYFNNNDDERNKLNPANWSHLSTRDHLDGMLSGKLPVQRNQYDVNKGKSPYYYLDEEGNEYDRPVGAAGGFSAGNTGQPQNTNYGTGTVQNGNFDTRTDNQGWQNNNEKSVQPLYNDCRGNQRYESFLQRLKSPGYEGTGYEDDPRLIDQPTHTGISQSFLGDVLKKYPTMEQAYKPFEGATLNDSLRNLNQDQIDNIYCQEYYKPYRIDDINNDRIAYSVFDTHVMSRPSTAANTFQKSLNDMGHPVARDGVFGSETISALNQIANKNQTDDFMEDHLKPNRINYLKSLGDNEKFSGRILRTRRY